MYKKYEKISPCILEEFFNKHNDRMKAYKIQGMHFLGLFREGEYIYPNVLKRNLKVSGEEAEYIFEELEKSGIVQKCYRHYCMNCGKEVGSFFTKESSIESFCPECDEQLDTGRKSPVYKVIKAI